MTGEPDAAGEADRLDLLAPRARRAPPAVRMRLGIGAAAVLIILALLVTVAVSLLTPHGDSRNVAAVTADTQHGAASTPVPTGRSATASLYVHVLGAVNRAGLYELRPGARVIDAIGAAGGFSAEADQGGVNLARLLVDGEQLLVPRVGEAPAAGVAPAAPGVPGVPGATQKVNLNTATEDELETLPRVGPAMAARILQWRKDNGRFATVDDLMNITGIGDKTFDALKDLVVV
jgi:competence protein ComEA